MKIYYEDDANLEIIQSMNVTIVGYGSQGHAHANNLHESGVNVTVALREGSSSWKKAEEAGLNVSSVSESSLVRSAWTRSSTWWSTKPIACSTWE